ncbi:hypothetical protein H0E87_018691 [Populus deltoides]|uniref:protein-serine/threonine phosphatase n=1 Tax=Populus deltoides TaxID=3696 RepID=A0A8T2XR36_POPDE|nr:hypothetical protein H0E87_018691 [Populus deltoides]
MSTSLRSPFLCRLVEVLRIIFKVTKELPRGSNFSARREGIRSEDEMEIRPGSQVAMDKGPPSSLSEKAKTLQLGGRSLPPRLKIFKENKRQDRCHYQHFFLSRKSFFLGLLEVGGNQVQLSEAEIRQLCITSREIFLKQPNLLELEAPIKICGQSKQIVTSKWICYVYIDWNLNWLVIKAYVKLPELCSLWECDDIF